MLSSSRSSGGSGTVVASISATLLLLSNTISQVSAQSCSTFQTDGPSGMQTYNHYSFYDFRHLSDQESGTPVYSSNEDFPNGQFALATSPFFNSSIWTNHWSSMAFKQPASRKLFQYVDIVYTPLNVAIVPDDSADANGDTVLSLTTTRLDNYSPSAQIQSIDKFLHASVRMSARMLGPKGACGAFYLYGDDNNESDMELLTNDTNSLFHATNHPSQDPKGNSIPNASTIASIPQNGTANGTTTAAWSDWNDWRMDWLPDRTQWIVNGDLVVDKTWSPPKIPSFLAISMWSNGGTWTGNMSVGETATLEVRWIEIVYNTSTDATPAKDGTSCMIKSNNGGSNTQQSTVSAANQATNAATKSRITAGLMIWTIVIGSSLLTLL